MEKRKKRYRISIHIRVLLCVCLNTFGRNKIGLYIFIGWVPLRDVQIYFWKVRVFPQKSSSTLRNKYVYLVFVDYDWIKHVCGVAAYVGSVVHVSSNYLSDTATILYVCRIWGRLRECIILSYVSVVKGDFSGLWYISYPIATALWSQFNWLQYKLFMQIDNIEKREYYELEADNNNWNGRELEWQMNSSLYECLHISNDKESVLYNLGEQVLVISTIGARTCWENKVGVGEAFSIKY